MYPTPKAIDIKMNTASMNDNLAAPPISFDILFYEATEVGAYVG